MNWKEFFKPSVVKIIILILLLVLSFLFYMYHVTSYQVFFELRTDCPDYYKCYGCGGNFLSPIGYIVDFPWLIYSVAYDMNIRQGICVPYSDYFYNWQVIFQIMYFYLIACVLVFVYKKLKRTAI